MIWHIISVPLDLYTVVFTGLSAGLRAAYVGQLSPTFDSSFVIQYYFVSRHSLFMVLWFCTVCTDGLAVLFFEAADVFPDVRSPVVQFCTVLSAL